MPKVLPSAAVPVKLIVSWLTKFLLLKLPPNQNCRCPVKTGTLGSGATRLPALSTVQETTVTVPANVEVNQPSPLLLMMACSMPLPVPWITGASAATNAGQPIACGLGSPTTGAEVPDGVSKFAVWLQAVKTVTPQVKSPGGTGTAPAPWASASGIAITISAAATAIPHRALTPSRLMTTSPLWPDHRCSQRRALSTMG